MMWRRILTLARPERSYRDSTCRVYALGLQHSSYCTTSRSSPTRPAALRVGTNRSKEMWPTVALYMVNIRASAARCLGKETSVYSWPRHFVSL